MSKFPSSSSSHFPPPPFSSIRPSQQSAHLWLLSLLLQTVSGTLWNQYEPAVGMDVPSPLRYRPSPFFVDPYRLHCHSCMSPYLEDQFQFISHLYRRPMVFTEKCDHGQFDWRYVRSKNCTDACVTLRMNDRVGGRRRFGFMRGCLADIIHHNRTAVRFGELSRTTKSGASICSAIRLRDLFVSSERYGFDPHDHVDLCACIRPNCNFAIGRGRHDNFLLTFGLVISFALLSILTRLDSMMGPGESAKRKEMEEKVANDDQQRQQGEAVGGGREREDEKEDGILGRRRRNMRMCSFSSEPMVITPSLDIIVPHQFW